MKANILRILEISLLLFIFCLICSKRVLASEASVSANNCNVGESFTVTVTIPQDVSGYDIGGISVSYSDGSVQTAKRAVKANMDLSWPGNYTVSFPGKVEGNATISVNNIILVNSSQAVVNVNTTLETSITITNPTPESVPNQSADTSTSNNDITPVAPVTLNFKDTNEKMYINRRVNVRQNYGTNSSIIQTLAVGIEVTRTGISDGNKDGYSWSRVSYNGITGYVITGALTYDAPITKEEVTETTEETTEDKTEEQEEKTEEVSEEDDDKIATIAEELGTIPEVGINIMPFMFLGSSITCIIMMIEIKRRITK